MLFESEGKSAFASSCGRDWRGAAALDFHCSRRAPATKTPAGIIAGVRTYADTVFSLSADFWQPPEFCSVTSFLPGLFSFGLGGGVILSHLDRDLSPPPS